MNKYELGVIIKPNLEEEAQKAELEKVQALITRFGGAIEKVDEWGKRRLAYEIEKLTEGFYTFITFTADSKAPSEIESRIRIVENVIRYLIIRLDA
ncbi:MAG: 30S ribosomal protein S6 [Clostridiales bacterium]|nr:30S ribosomal protein S6 [Clostridiales bacterium]